MFSLKEKKSELCNGFFYNRILLWLEAIRKNAIWDGVFILSERFSVNHMLVYLTADTHLLLNSHFCFDQVIDRLSFITTQVNNFLLVLWLWVNQTLRFPAIASFCWKKKKRVSVFCFVILSYFLAASSHSFNWQIFLMAYVILVTTLQKYSDILLLLGVTELHSTDHFEVRWGHVICFG